MRLMRRTSLKFRLLAGALLWISASLLAAGLVLTGLFTAHVERRFDAELATHLDQLLAVLQQDEAGAISLLRPLPDPRFAQPYSALYWQVDRPDGSAVRSRSLWDWRLALPRDTPADGELHRHLLQGPDGQPLVAVERKVTLPGRSEVVRAAVAGDLRVVRAARAAFARMAALTLGALAVGLVLTVVALVLATLRPLSRLQHSLGAVRAGEARQVAGDFPGELQPLVDDLNGLLRHNATVLERARTAAGNLAHELKTPLAIISNAMGAAEPSEATGTALEQAALMRRRIDHALMRARAAASANVLGATTRAGTRLPRLAQAMRTLYGARGIAVALTGNAEAPIRIEPHDFDEIVGNLLDNACKWARSRVDVSAEQDARGMRLTIDDDGPGLPEAERANVFARGRKLDENAPGAGLGLSIVRDLVEAYGGRIALQASSRGGLRATLWLPLAAASRRPARTV